MRQFLLLLILLTNSQLGFTQQITCSPKDKAAVEEKINTIERMLQSNYGNTLVSVGKTFVTTPYVAKTLEIGDTETLVVNLQGLDCTTFVENVLAFSMLLRQQEYSFDAFINNLEIIRYKDGVLDGYASRLHYFSEWIANNAEKTLVKDITGEIGGIEITKDIDFMSTHRNLYPYLADDLNFAKIKDSEDYLKNQIICVLAQNKIAENEHLIQSGDIIALATSINGLDVTHTGIATREIDGRIHLLHASTGSMEVEVSKLPLADYLKNIKSNIGIMVARPL
ncbi:N-acetylmuramoyl-L-alanine amidase-like domain-containing protein [uncultured Maribacter sp.]|uniref:N-acetylmuramoyl-L-alanine amidase-like domain-containing protein n=1 Tax=uncultured Maribacter sp. TaxID=431308 RepID=UPI0030EF4DCC|tara:strand:+ start:95130 stop:95972 length:843 start_codon:yes stop_codon:yes gene_type:complete